MNEITNNGRLTWIQTDVAGIIRAAERGEPEIVETSIEELTAFVVGCPARIVGSAPEPLRAPTLGQPPAALLSEINAPMCKLII